MADKKYILEINKMQYVSAIGETILVRISKESSEKDIEVNVLAEIDGENIIMGKPNLNKKIKFSLGEAKKQKKVVKDFFRAKSRYHRKVGFRPVSVEFNLEEVK